MRGEKGKNERLFRAAISAFCSLTRPSRREIAQIDDLTLPLFDSVSVESRRFVAAALSECEYPPAALVRRLCDEPVEIAAPLLMRSSGLTDIDLISIIGRHGLPHARAIARRSNLNPTIADLIKALEKPPLVSSRTASATITALPERGKAMTGRHDGVPVSGRAAEEARHRLRVIMAGQTGEGPNVTAHGQSTYAKLRETALTGSSAFFNTALADALDLDFNTARSLTANPTYSPLLVALRALNLGEDRAFLIAVAVFPKLFPHPQAIRIFLDRYRTLHPEAAMEKVDGWKAEKLSRELYPIVHAAANADAGGSSPMRSGVKAS